jgi:hypothetical protein
MYGRRQVISILWRQMSPRRMIHYPPHLIQPPSYNSSPKLIVMVKRMNLNKCQPLEEWPTLWSAGRGIEESQHGTPIVCFTEERQEL